MNFIDITIIVALVFFAIVGFNNGVFKSLLNIIGFLITFYVAYLLKNTIANLLILNLPFMKFGTLLGSVPSLNILLYQILSLILLVTFAELLFNVIVSVLGLGDKLLKLTVKFRLPAKILGIFSGVVEGYMIIFLCAFVLSQPFIGLRAIVDSKISHDMLRNTPLLSDWNRDFINVFDGLDELMADNNSKLNDVNVSQLLLNENMISKESFGRILELRKLDNTNEELKKLAN